MCMPAFALVVAQTKSERTLAIDGPEQGAGSRPVALSYIDWVTCAITGPGIPN